MKRVFNIKFGDNRVLSKVDAAGEAGRFGALNKYVEFDYNNGKVTVDGIECKNAIVDDNKLVVEFEKTILDNPFVHGIILYNGGIDQTDAEDQK